MEDQRNGPVRQQIWTTCDGREKEALVSREWLVTNGLGGYASGTVSGVNTRRYHGLLIAALPAPLGRTLMLNHLSEQIRLENGQVIAFGGEELLHGGLELHCSKLLKEFRLEMGLPVWRFEISGILVEKRIVVPNVQNTVFVTYRLLLQGPESLLLELRPSMGFRGHEDDVDSGLIPNHFPEKGSDGAYNTADATLWFTPKTENCRKTVCRRWYPGTDPIC